MARAAADELRRRECAVEVFDLSVTTLPACDGASAYGDANVISLAEKIRQSDAILIASPVYNYDVNAAAKNAVELTGKAWTGKVVGMMLAAGGGGSYMSAMGLANSLMLDFRCIIVPRFIYATGDSFEGNSISDTVIDDRIGGLIDQTLQLANAIAGPINRGNPPSL